MNGILEIIKNATELGLIYSLVTMAVFLTSKVIKFDDLSTEGSFATGGAITAICLVNNINIWISILVAIISGGIVGLCTGILHTKLQINNLISGLIVTTAVFSINLKIAGANLALNSNNTLFSYLKNNEALCVLIPICLLILFLLQIFLKTEVGFLLKTVGCNPQMITNLGKNIAFYKIIGLAIANALTALAGSLFVQYAGFFSITGSIGTLIIALAGLTLSEIIKSNLGIAILIGSVLYQSIFAITIELNLDPVWNKLISAIIMVLLLALKTNNIKGKQ